MKYILFDLDGTLTDPAEGITNSVAYALRRYGISVEDNASLNCFIGPPLTDSFEKFYGFSHEAALEAVEVYREYFRPKGIFENKVYEGIPELLARLKGEGKKLIMATSKPEIFACRIAEHFGFKEYFDLIAGSTLDGSRVKKHDVIENALERFGISDRSECVMIGDRLHDIEGAKASGLFSIGVLWGYGDRGELADAGADLICESVVELFDMICSLK